MANDGSEQTQADPNGTAPEIVVVLPSGEVVGSAVTAPEEGDALATEAPPDWTRLAPDGYRAAVRELVEIEHAGMVTTRYTQGQRIVESVYRGDALEIWEGGPRHAVFVRLSRDTGGALRADDLALAVRIYCVARSLGGLEALPAHLSLDHFREVQTRPTDEQVALIRDAAETGKSARALAVERPKATTPAGRPVGRPTMPPILKQLASITRIVGDPQVLLDEARRLAEDHPAMVENARAQLQQIAAHLRSALEALEAQDAALSEELRVVIPDVVSAERRAN